MASKPPARLYCLLAREARTGVIFRRGPSREVLLIRWNMEIDTFETGQWIHARIYERRCDLSPKGDKLVYFAATYKEPLGSWTALSKPPWLTAIALWPKGDGWNGGGYFESDDSLVLNHCEAESQLREGSDLGTVRVTGYATHHGEDDTVHHHLLRRGGWVFVQEVVWQKSGQKPPNSFDAMLELIERDDQFAAAMAEHGITPEQLEKTKQNLNSIFTDDSGWSPQGWIAEKPEVWEKAHPTQPLLLRQELHGIARRNQNWYDMRYSVLKSESRETLQDLGPLDWAEWDSNGDLLYAQKGCLYRVRESNQALMAPVQLADFNGLTFAAIESPDEAKKW